MKPPIRVLHLLFLMFWACHVLRPAILPARQTASDPPATPVLVVKLGYTDDGAITSAWQDAIRARHDAQSLAALLAGKKKPAPEEARWVDLIQQKAAKWPAMIDSLRIPFNEISPPDTVTILLGHQGGEDAFVSGATTICFEVSKLNALYGAASDPANSERIDRFFAHEFTHLLHKAWRQKHGLRLNSPLDFALWECLTEGLGNYRSLSSKWRQSDGALTTHAEVVLARLQPVFVQRLAALQHADHEQVAALLQGLSSGPFEQKWGALTVALWLARETAGDDTRLQPWVEAGPLGVLVLARKYLPTDLQDDLPKITAK